MTDFDAWFQRLTGTASPPHDWQRSLAATAEPRSRLIRVPTGMGKTLGVLAAWAWHRLERRDDAWPRRLVWCLPMRVLVEQTEAVAREALGRVRALWDGAGDHGGQVGVHLLMGGADAGGDWHLYPEECAVLVGTQDMLLSRALNRGYACGRARWPLEFGLLSHDALWVMDEVQLMDVGLSTGAQLQAYFDEDAAKGFRPRHTWWMSATLQPAWLKSVDTRPRHGEWTREPVSIPAERRAAALGSAVKRLALDDVASGDAKGLAERVLAQHRSLAAGEYGRITLVVCNTVDRASTTFDALRRQAPAQELHLVNSRFRPAERAGWRSFLSRDACVAGADRIVVATQVVEAGVDVSAGCVVTDLAPWPSLVQRFGRCARYGGDGLCLVLDRGRDDKDALPYSAREIEAARAALAEIAAQGTGVGTARLEEFEEGLDDEERRTLFPYEPQHLLLRRERDELFDTTPDLTGADLDVSRFIRGGEERDLQVFWADVPAPPKRAPPVQPPPRLQPRREELCAVPFLAARDWLCGKEAKSQRKPRLRAGMRAWIWDWLAGEWVAAERSLLTPGRVVCVAAGCGGYRVERGFDPASEAPVPVVPSPPLPPAVDAEIQADAREDGDDVSAGAWKTIACHADEAVALASRIAARTRLPAAVGHALALAARWHDAGKAHSAFQGAIRHPGRPDRQDLAKAPGAAWPRPPATYRSADDRDLRPGLRHELASALALFAVLGRHAPRHPGLLGPWIEVLELTGQAPPAEPGDLQPTPCESALLACSAEEFDLVAYLVASHHGKVRAALHAAPRDQDYRDPGDGRGLPIRGVREGDVLPPVVLTPGEPPLPPLTLTLEPAALGLSSRTGRSWRERTLDLLDRFGPGGLAWLEALLIAADRRASRLATADPALVRQEPAP